MSPESSHWILRFIRIHFWVVFIHLCIRGFASLGRRAALEKRRTPITPSQRAAKERKAAPHTIGLGDKKRGNVSVLFFLPARAFQVFGVTFRWVLGVNLQKFRLKSIKEVEK
jgi:hypothetical protein